MRVRSEKCEGCPLPAYKVARPKKSRASQKSKIFASILQAHVIVGVPFVHHKPLTSNNNNKNSGGGGREILAYQRESVRMWWNAWDSRSMRESWQLWRLGNEDKAPCPRALLPGRGSNRGPPVWKSEVLTARPRQLLKWWCMFIVI